MGSASDVKEESYEPLGPGTAGVADPCRHLG